MDASEIKGVLLVVIFAGVGVAWLGHSYPIMGYVLIAVTMVLAGLATWRRARGDADGSTWAPLFLVGAVIAFTRLGNCVKDSGEEHRRRTEQQAVTEQRRARAEEAAQRQEQEAQRRKRKQLIDAELARPLDERVTEAQTSLESAMGPEAVAREICYADTLLEGVETNPAIKKLKKVRNQAAKEVTSERRAELSKHRGLLCRDGTASPSCSCGGSRRGCCSHHGGVAGCEPKPTVEIDCEGAPIHYWLERHLVGVGRALPPSVDAPVGPPPSPLRIYR